MSRGRWLAALLQIVAATGAAAFDYAAYKEELRRDPALIRFYTFEEGAGDEVANQVDLEPGRLAMSGGPLGSLTILNDSPYGTDRTNYHYQPGEGVPGFEWTEGRHPGKSALTNGLGRRGLFRNGLDGQELEQATFAGWLRVQPLAGPAGEAAILTLGNAYDCGFSLVYRKAPYAPDGMIAFRLGNAEKQPVTLQVQGVEPGVWQHFAVTLDGREAVLYWNGKPAARAAAGRVVPPVNREYGSEPFYEYSERAAFLRVGGSPLGPRGSARYDLDELAIYRRALSAAEVAALEQRGRPEAGREAQLARWRELEAAQKIRSAIQMTIPHETMGFFEIGKPVPIRFAVEPGSGLTGPLQAEYELRDLAGTVLKRESRTFQPEAGCELALELPRCDVLVLELRVRDAGGRVLKTMNEPYVLGVVPPSPERLTASNPLGYLAVLDAWNYNFPIRRMFFYFDLRDNPEYCESFLRTLAEDRARIPGCRPLVCIQIPWLETITPEDRKSLSEGFARIAALLKGQVWAWEISNEPNGKISPENYFEILKLAVAELRRSDPQLPICAPGASPSGLPFINDLLKLGMGELIDAVSFHNYVGAPLAAYHWNNTGRELRRMIDEHCSKALPIWNSESGFFTIQRVGGKPVTMDVPARMGMDQSNFRGVRYFHTSMPALPETEAAARQVQAILLDLASGYRIYVKCQSAALAAVDGTSTGALPTRMGVALTVLGGQILNDLKSVAFLPMSALDRAALLITGQSGSRTAAIFSQEPAVLNFQAEPDRSYRTLDYLGNPGELRSDAAGLLTVNSSETPLYVFDVPTAFREIPVLSLTLPEKLGEDGRLTGELLVRNPFDRELSGTLRVVPLPGAGISVTPEAVKLTPGAELKCRVDLTATALKRREYEVKIELLREREVVAAAQRMFASDGVIYPVPQLKTAFALDGKLDKWADIPALICRDEENVVHGKPNLAETWLPQWRGNDDLSFTLKCVWRRRDGLYFLLEVTDDRLLPAPADQTGMAFRYDCLELFFDGRPTPEQGKPIADGADQVIIIPRTGETAEPCELWYARKDQARIEVSCLGGRTERGYWIEGRIRPRTGSAFQLLAGSRFCWDFLVDDADAPDQLRKAAMALHGDFDNSISSLRWGRCELSLDGPAAAAAAGTPDADLTASGNDAMVSAQEGSKMKNWFGLFAGSTAAIPAVRNFSPERFCGRWYEIARLSHRFERGLTGVNAEYRQLDDGTIEVINRGFRDGALREIRGVARVRSDAAGTGELTVTFFPPFRAAYRVIELTADYSVAVITGSNFNYLWLLARTPELPPEVVAAYRERLGKLGFAVDRLEYPGPYVAPEPEDEEQE